MKYKLILAVALSLAAEPCLAEYVTHLKPMTHYYGSDRGLEPIDETFKRALLDTGWTPIESAPGHIVAKTVVNMKHHATVDIVYGNGEAVIKLIDSQDLRVGPCTYREDEKVFRGSCVSPRYYDWLEKVMAALPAAHAKLRAEAADPQAAARLAANTFVYEALLTGSSVEASVAGRTMRLPPQALLDLAAQVLHETCARNPLTDDDRHALIALGHALGATRTQRYRKVVATCLTTIENNRVEHALQTAIDAMAGVAPAYEPGTVNVAAVRDRVAQAMASKPAAAPATLVAIPYGAPVRQLLAASLPDRVSALRANQEFDAGPSGLRETQPKVVFEYTGVARVLLTTIGGPEPHWIVHLADYALERLPADDRVLAIKRMFSSYDTALRSFNAARLSNVTFRDAATLDPVAQRIFEIQALDDPATLQELTTLIELIGRSRQGRYRTFMSEISATAPRPVRPLATAASRRLPRSGEPFAPAR